MSDIWLRSAVHRAVLVVALSLCAVLCGSVLVDLDHPLAVLLGISDQRFLHSFAYFANCSVVAFAGGLCLGMGFLDVKKNGIASLFASAYGPSAGPGCFG